MSKNNMTAADFVAQQAKRRTHKQEAEGIRHLAVLHGWKAYLLHQSGRIHGSGGVPDIFLISSPGDMLWWEVKTVSSKLLPSQDDFLLRVAFSNGLAGCGTADDFISFLGASGNEDRARLLNTLREKYARKRRTQ